MEIAKRDPGLSSMHGTHGRLDVVLIDPMHERTVCFGRSAAFRHSVRLLETSVPRK